MDHDERRVIIDTRRHASSVPPHAILGGLPLFERATRFAAKCGWEHAYVLGSADRLPSIDEPRLTLEFVDSAPDGIQSMRSDVLYGHGDIVEPLFTLDSPQVLARAEDYLWNSCRKSADGIVSRHLNRHLSLAISRRIAHTGVMPNHVTAVTFSLGIAAAGFAAVGGWAGFAIAGVLFQLASILDGVDGELARVRFDGSVKGEWFDTISDDSSDLFLYATIGIGASRTLYAAPTIPPSLWLWLGFGAAAGKLLSMAIYYRWLAERGRGDLLAFTWSFDEEPDRSPVHRVLSVIRYATKNDFIALTVMVLGLLNLLPWLLFAALPGTIAVAIGALSQSGDD